MATARPSEALACRIVRNPAPKSMCLHRCSPPDGLCFCSNTAVWVRPFGPVGAEKRQARIVRCALHIHPAGLVALGQRTCSGHPGFPALKASRNGQDARRQMRLETPRGRVQMNVSECGKDARQSNAAIDALPRTCHSRRRSWPWRCETGRQVARPPGFRGLGS